MADPSMAGPTPFPETLDIIMVSFEGPDEYSQAGGLGVRATELTRALARRGHRTTLCFVGSPDAPTEEVRDGVRLLRWSQDVSRAHPGGVYDGEREKIADIEGRRVAPLVDEVIRPAAQRGRQVAVLIEEWQLAGFCIALDRRLREAGLRDRCVLLWNANNTFEFDSIDWRALSAAATITTISRYMRQLIRRHAADAFVIPNGIAPSWLAPPDQSAAAAIRYASGTVCLLFKIGRFSPDKGWEQALAATAQLRREGVPARLLLRGDRQPYGATVLARAADLGLEVAPWEEPVADHRGIARALAETRGAPVVDLRRFLPEDVIPVISAAATAVLANSNHEPFGLAGLETMAAGGLAVVGATGEDYARPYGNCIVVDTEEGEELAAALRGIIERPDLAGRICEAGRREAAAYAWPMVIEGLLEKVPYLSRIQRRGQPPAGPPPAPLPAGVSSAAT